MSPPNPFQTWLPDALVEEASFELLVSSTTRRYIRHALGLGDRLRVYWAHNPAAPKPKDILLALYDVRCGEDPPTRPVREIEAALCVAALRWSNPSGLQAVLNAWQAPERPAGPWLAALARELIPLLIGTTTLYSQHGPSPLPPGRLVPLRTPQHVENVCRASPPPATPAGRLIA